MTTTKEIKKLRDMTGARITECKKALEESSGNLEKAIEELKKRNAVIAEKKCEKGTIEGYIDSYIHGNGKIGVLIEVNCETDFVAKNSEFRNLVHDLAMHIAAFNPKYICYEDINKEELEEKKKELMSDPEIKSKKEDIAKKIVEGKTKKHFCNLCLMTQLFVKNPNITVGNLLTEKISMLGENIKIKRFIRFEI